MIKFRITEEDENRDSFHVASVQSPEGMTQEQAEKIMATAWDEFQATHPDTDSEFGEWLVENHGFVEIECDFVDFTVGN